MAEQDSCSRETEMIYSNSDIIITYVCMAFAIFICAIMGISCLCGSLQSLLHNIFVGVGMSYSWTQWGKILLVFIQGFVFAIMAFLSWICFKRLKRNLVNGKTILFFCTIMAGFSYLSYTGIKQYPLLYIPLGIIMLYACIRNCIALFKYLISKKYIIL